MVLAREMLMPEIEQIYHGHRKIHAFYGEQVLFPCDLRLQLRGLALGNTGWCASSMAAGV